MKIRLKQTIDKLLAIDQKILQELMLKENFDKNAVSKQSYQINLLSERKILIDNISDQEALSMIADLEEEIDLCKKIFAKQGIDFK